MAGFDVQRVIAAYQAGKAIKDQKEQKARDLEDRDWEIKQRQAQLKMDTIQQQLMKRKLEQENAGAMEGRPAQEQTIPPIMMQNGLPATAETTMEAPMAPQQISGIPELGVEGYTVNPRSAQELLRQQRSQKVFDSQLKKEENTFTINDPTTGQPISGPKELLDNFMTQTGQNARQVDQQAFTSQENEKRLKAESEKAVADRQSRESIANANRLQTAANAAKSGSQTKAVQQALAESARFDSNQIVKNYAVIQEGLNAAKSMATGGTSADDIGLLYAFAKAMDPNSVVREGEYATVQKYAQSWAEQFGFKAARVFTNSQFLTDQARKNMISVIEKKAQAAKSSYENLRTSAAKKIGNVGEDPEKWLGNYEVGRDKPKTLQGPNGAVLTLGADGLYH